MSDKEKQDFQGFWKMLMQPNQNPENTLECFEAINELLHGTGVIRPINANR